ncbi:MAG: metallophosphoesterase [Clostridia bacterium]|nr:metallophosphoesterase [Clostridia bacterium]
MKIFSISDLHLSTQVNKPMDIFGGNWENYFEKIKQSWEEKVGTNDIVLISGDISWGMRLEEAIPDLMEISKLKGIKILVKGNHDYWWQSISAIRKILPQNMYCIQNDAIKIGDYIICGSRGWTVPEEDFKTDQDKKIFDREAIRLEIALKTAKDLQTNNEKIIVMIHYPPFNSLTQNGYTDLFEKYNVSACVYGHIHGEKCRSQKVIQKNGILYYLTSCDQVNNELVEITF